MKPIDNVVQIQRSLVPLTRTSWACLVVIGLVSIASLALRAVIPLNPMGFADGFFDDGFFERSAVSLAGHAWLGPFDHVTLAKGPSFSAFVAACHQIGATPAVGAQFTCLVGAGGLTLCLWLITARPIGATVVFVILALDPMNFNLEAARVVRDDWYAGLSLMFYSSLLLTALLAVQRKHMLLLLPAAALTGLSGAAFWLCREEGIWIVPSALLTVVAVPIVALVDNCRRRGLKRCAPIVIARRYVGLAVAVVVAATMFVGPVALVGKKNERAYGVDLSNDLVSGAFADAYSTWSQVRGVELTPFVPINRAQREAVYAISAHARELRPILEDPENGWIQYGCSSVGVCDDFAGGWEPWAIREATVSIGHFSNEPDFQAFFGLIASDIKFACKNGRLQCAAAVWPSFQPLQRSSAPTVIRSAMYWLGQLPLSPSYYSFLDRDQMFHVTESDRAAMKQGISGVETNDGDALASIDRYDGVYRWMHVALGYLFPPLFLVLLVLAVTGVILGLFFRSEGPRQLGLWVLTASLALGVSARLLLFAVVDTTQFLIVARYHYATRTFLLALAAIGAMHAIAVVRLRARAGSRREPA